MTTDPAPKYAGALPDLLVRAEIPAEAAALLAGIGTPAEAIGALAAAEFLAEAARLAAHALPRREAVWWACMCARHTAPAEPPPLAVQVCEAAETWVRRPGEDAGRAAWGLANQLGFEAAESWAAAGAFWAGESMSEPHLPKVPPPPHLTGTAVACAILLASVRHAPLRREERLRRFLASAGEIAAGGTGRLALGG
jgi:hypothetical protein